VAAKASPDVGPALAPWSTPLAIAALTLAVFSPALNHGFLNWDDEPNLVANLDYRGLGWSQLKWMFTTVLMGHYQPLSWVTFGIDYLIWGMSPRGYHLTNLLLHAGNAVLFYFISRRLLTRVGPSVTKSGVLSLQVAAGFAALVFAIHPLRVESVAWVTERRDVLSGLFILATIICYLNGVMDQSFESARRRAMNWSVIFYFLSLLSKASGMTLPVVLLLLDVYPLRRLGWRPGNWTGAAARAIYLEKVPFILLGVGAASVAATAQHFSGAMLSWENYGFLSRLAQAVYGLVFYLWKSLMPLNLSPLYEIPQDTSIRTWPIILSGAIVIALSLGLFRARQRYPGGLASWVCYVVTLAPVLGFAQSGSQMAADRYSYLACMSWAVLAGGALKALWNRRVTGWVSRQSFVLANSIAIVILLALGVLTWNQTQVWSNSETLWRHALSVGPSTIAHYHLALTLDRREESGKAVEHYRKSLQIRPNYLDARIGLAQALVRRGEWVEAIEHYGRALEIKPGDANLHVGLANVKALNGRSNEAITHYREALRIDPANSDAYFNLGNCFARMGHRDKAMENYRDAVRVNPAHSHAHFTLANALANEGNLDEAMEHYEQATSHKPDFAEAHHNLGRIMAARGQIDRAIAQFRRAVAVRPEFAEAHLSLSRALAEKGNKNEAMRHYQESVRILRNR